jgi:energy-coupling factor transporter ATP-binding protein EcfA2
MGVVAMIQLIAGEKGQGKTKRLVQMANDSVKNTDGRVVFVDKNNRHMYTLHYDIRLVEINSFHLSNYREFIGFLYGILAMDNDIKEIYVDGLKHVIQSIDNESLVELLDLLEKLNAAHGVNFVSSISCDPESLPEAAKKYLI